MATPNRSEFADETAQAYVRQFGIDGSPVMNQMTITWDGDNFDSHSSLSVTAGEIVVLALEDGIFGGEGMDTDEEMYESIYGYLTDEGNNGSDDLWREVLSTIEDADS
jgi:hypothetical protein